MDTLFVIILLLSFLSLIVFGILWIINIIKKEKIIAKKRLQYAGLSLGVLMISFIVIGITADPIEPSEKAKKEENLIQKEEKEKEKAAIAKKEKEEKEKKEKAAIAKKEKEEKEEKEKAAIAKKEKEEKEKKEKAAIAKKEKEEKEKKEKATIAKKEKEEKEKKEKVAIAEKEKEEKEKKEKAAKAKKEREEKEKIAKREKNNAQSIGYGIDEFSKRFNIASKEFDSSFRISDPTITDGAVQDVASITLNKYIAMNVSINKENNTVRDIFIIGQGDGTVDSGLDILVTIGTVIVATNPELTPDERGKVLKDLGLMNETGLSSEKKSTERNGIKYTLESSDIIGVMFTVANSKDTE